MVHFFHVSLVLILQSHICHLTSHPTSDIIASLTNKVGSTFLHVMLTLRHCILPKKSEVFQFQTKKVFQNKRTSPYPRISSMHFLSTSALRGEGCIYADVGYALSGVTRRKPAIINLPTWSACTHRTLTGEYAKRPCVRAQGRTAGLALGEASKWSSEIHDRCWSEQSPG